MAETALVTSERVVRVLLIDDDEEDFLLTRDLLEEVPGTRFEVDWESEAEAGLETICRAEHDVYLIDYRLGAITGLDLIREAEIRHRSAPLILLTGQGERELDFAAMRAGAADYLEKGKLDSTLLDRSIRYSIQKKQSEEQLEKRVLERTAELAKANEDLQNEVRERLRAQESLLEVDRRKDEFLATLAHELRNPLAPIRNALEIMRLGGNNGAALERGRALMERQVVHMVRIIDDLLDISRITRGKILLRKEQDLLGDIIANAVEVSKPSIDLGKHELTVSLPESPVLLTVDSARMVQVVANLLNNAAKFTMPGGKIGLHSHVEGNHLVLRVSDNGIGIPAELLPKIFDMFAQVERYRDRAQGGLGVGLSLARALVHLHGGTIEANSTGTGDGSEFVIRLPLTGQE